MPDASSLMTMQQIRYLYNLQKANVTANYDSTATYEIGDFCLYLGVLYRCISTISTAEDFDSSHWVSTNVDAELDRIKTTLSDVYRKSQTYSKTEAVAKADIVNVLNSTLTTAPLSAAQGKALYDMLTTYMIANVYGSSAFNITAGGTIGEYLTSQTFNAAPVDGYVVRFATIDKFAHPGNYLPLLSTDVNAGTARVDIYRTSTTAINLSDQDFRVRFYYIRV